MTTSEPRVSVQDLAAHLRVAFDSMYRWIEGRGLPANKTGDEAKVSESIEVLNERFGPELTAANQLLFDQFVAAAKLDDEVVQRAKVNPLDTFAPGMKGKVEQLMVDRYEIVTGAAPSRQRDSHDLTSRSLGREGAVGMGNGGAPSAYLDA